MAYIIIIFIIFIILFISSMLLNFTLLSLIKLGLFNKDLKSLLKQFINIEGCLNNERVTEFFNKNFVNTKINFTLPFRDEVSLYTLSITGNKDETCNVLSELNKVGPYWKDKLILSPLEPNTTLTQFVLESLNIHYLLNIIIIYLLIMLLIIFMCKLVLNQNTEFNNLNKYPLGNLINKFLVKYINIWQTSGNV